MPPNCGAILQIPIFTPGAIHNPSAGQSFQKAIYHYNTIYYTSRCFFYFIESLPWLVIDNINKSYCPIPNSHLICPPGPTNCGIFSRGELMTKNSTISTLCQSSKRAIWGRKTFCYSKAVAVVAPSIFELFVAYLRLSPFDENSSIFSAFFAARSEKLKLGSTPRSRILLLKRDGNNFNWLCLERYPPVWRFVSLFRTPITSTSFHCFRWVVWVPTWGPRWRRFEFDRRTLFVAELSRAQLN